MVAFSSDLGVSSYRLAKLSSGFFQQKLLMANKQSELLENTSRQNTILDGDYCLISNFDMIWKNRFVIYIIAQLAGWSKAVCVCVCLDVNQMDTNRNCCTQRLVILRARTYY